MRQKIAPNEPGIRGMSEKAPPAVAEAETAAQAFVVERNDGEERGMAVGHGGGNRFAHAVALGLGAFVALTLPTRSAAAQSSEQVLYSFCAQPNCRDGSLPFAGLIMDAAGKLYGTTIGGGNSGRGAVFELAPDGTETVLYSFCQQSGCADGDNPFAGLIMDSAGNLYGTTSQGGIGGGLGRGVAFELTPDGTETVLYSFCQQSGCADGLGPFAGLIRDAAGNLYGTTYQGGTTTTDCNFGCGVVFKLAPDGTETVLYSFCAQGFNCEDGAFPEAGLIMDAAGNLYGTTYYGGADTGCGNSGCGTVFKLTPDPTGTMWTETVLYAFCTMANCADGAHPYAGLIMDGMGNLYGTTFLGGSNNGVVFKLAPDGTETVLYSFCAQPNCADGALPEGGVIMDAAGNLYGTTVGGGTSNVDGVVFELAPDGTETVLYSFCQQSGCADGDNPFAGLIMDAAGNLYGTTLGGGTMNGGGVFKLSPAAASSSCSTWGSNKTAVLSRNDWLLVRKRA